MVLGAKRLGYEAKRLGYGGERLGLKIETKRLGGKRLGEMTRGKPAVLRSIVRDFFVHS